LFPVLEISSSPTTKNTKNTTSTTDKTKTGIPGLTISRVAVSIVYKLENKIKRDTLKVTFLKVSKY